MQTRPDNFRDTLKMCTPTSQPALFVVRKPRGNLQCTTNCRARLRANISIRAEFVSRWLVIGGCCFEGAHAINPTHVSYYVPHCLTKGRRRQLKPKLSLCQILIRTTRTPPNTAVGSTLPIKSRRYRLDSKYTNHTRLLMPTRQQEDGLDLDRDLQELGHVMKKEYVERKSPGHRQRYCSSTQNSCLSFLGGGGGVKQSGT